MKEPEKEKSQSIVLGAAVVAILIPASYILSWIFQAGDLSNFDYWWMTWNFYSVEGLSPNPFNWIFRANEHFVLIPALIYGLNILATQGSNMGLCLVAWLLAWMQCHVLIALLPSSLRRSPFLFLCLVLCIAIFTFTPAAAHNWMRGFSGVHWIIANLFAIASIFCLQQLVEGQSERWAGGSLLFGILGCMSYSTPLAVWPVLCAAAIRLRLPRRLIYAYLAVSAATIAIYFLTYKTPTNHPSLAKVSIGEAIAYFPVYLGGIFSENLLVATAIGTVGLIAAAGFIGYWLFFKHPQPSEWLPWLSIQVYTLGTALMAAVSRSGFGVEQATASRYATLPALFWLSLAIVTVLGIRRWQPLPRIQRRWLMPVIAVVTVGTIAMYSVGAQTAAAIAHRATYQPLVALSLQLGITDITLIQERVGNKPAAFVGLIDALKANHLVPFNRDIKTHNFCAPLGEKINPTLLSAPKDGVPGFFDAVQPLAPQAARVMGWVGDPSDRVKCIALLNQDNVVRGFALSGFPRPDLVKQFGPAYENAAWKGYVEILPGDRWLTAYASFKDRGGWIALQNSQILQKK